MMLTVMGTRVSGVRAAFGVERGVHLSQICSEAVEHVLDDVVGPDAKNPIPDFSRQMPISQMPGKAHELIRIVMPHFDDRFRSGPNPEPSPIFELQAISIGHGHRVGEIEKDVLTLIHGQANATAMARLVVERERTGRSFLRPMAGGSMGGSARDGRGVRSHVST